MDRIIFILCSILVFNFSNAQQLESLLEEALLNNPEIQKFELQHSIASEKVNEVNSIPNTEVGVGYFASEPETRTGAQRLKVSARQMLPWFGSIEARENYVNSVSETASDELLIAKKKLIASVSQSYYNLYTIQEKQQILQHNIDLLKTYEKMALTSVEVGKASAVEVLRLQIRQNELEEVKQALDFDYGSEQTAFNNLLNRKNSIPVTIINSLVIPLEKESIETLNLEVHPELTKYDKLYESVAYLEQLNQKESQPMFGFGLDYIAVSERPDMNFSDNGKDIIMPMVSVSIPIFNKKHKSVSKQNELQQLAINSQKMERMNVLETALIKAVNTRNSARVSYETQSKNLKQAKDAEEILIKSYETGTIDFDDVLAIQELQLKFQMAQIASIRNYFVQSSIINYLQI